MVTTTPPAPEAPVPISPIGRITGALFSPSRTFSDIAARPSWIAPTVLLLVLGFAVGALLGQKTDWRAFFERQMSNSSRFDQMSQAQKDQILESQT